MLTIKQCRKILGIYAKDLTDEEVGRLRDLLYTIGSFEYQPQDTDENSNPLHPRIDGRTKEERI